MRNSVVVAVVGLAGLTVAVALVAIDRHATTDLPPAPAPSTALAPANKARPADNSQGGTASASGAALAAKTPAPPSVLQGGSSDLPNIDVATLPVHPVPSGEPSVPTVILEDRNGKTIKEIKPSAPLPSSLSSSPIAAPTPGFVTPSGVPPRAAPTRPATTTTVPNSTFGGAAQAISGTVLSVGGYSVRLFGVRPAEPRDRCSLGPGDNRSCNDVARAALAQRLQHYPNVSCRAVPPGRRTVTAAVCLDGSGTDLGGFLVAEGYALADTSQSVDYAGAEGAAQTFRRGLWKNR